MAKKGQHKNDAWDPRQGHGNTSPRESMEITAGTPKKRETYDKQAREHKDTAPEAQRSNVKIQTPGDARVPSPGVRARRVRSGRSGSDSAKDG